MLEKRKADWGIDLVSTDPEALIADPSVDAVIIATPNFTHLPIALAAAKHGKHVMCEKPLGVNKGEVQQMYEAARDAGIVHMTAFTYRFAPSMKYLRHLLKSGAWDRPATSARSGSSTSPRPPGAGVSTRTRRAPATSTT